MKPIDELEATTSRAPTNNDVNISYISDGGWWNGRWEYEVKERPSMDGGHVQVAADIVSYLGAEHAYESLEKFFNKVQNRFPKHFHEKFMKNEIFRLGMIELKLWQKQFRDVYALIENGKFSHPETLISIWDKAHYGEKQKQTGKTYLSPVSKFRIREKYPPPPNICPDGIRCGNGHTFTKSAQKVLKQWLQTNTEHPFPNRQEIEEMIAKTGLSLQQIRNWFSNARRRSPEKRKRSDKDSRDPPPTRKTNLLSKLLDAENDDRSDETPPLTCDQQNEEISCKDAPNKEVVTQNQIIIVYVPVYQQLDSSDVNSKVSTVIMPPLTRGQFDSVDRSQDELIRSIIASELKNTNSFETSEFSSQMYSSNVNENVILEQVVKESDSHLIIDSFDLQNGSQDAFSCGSQIDVKQLAAEVLLNLSHGLVKK